MEFPKVFFLVLIIIVGKSKKQYSQVEGNLIEKDKGHGLLYSGTEGIVVARNQISHNSKHALSLVHPIEITIQGNCLKIITYQALMSNYNLGHNILELYNVLVQIQLTTSKTEHDI